MVTASAHPAVRTIQPELWPLVRWSTTLATTPSPNTIRIAVPNSSARTGDMAVPGLVVWGKNLRAAGLLREGRRQAWGESAGTTHFHSAITEQPLIRVASSK